MPISNDWTFLKSFLRKSYNREVARWFRDLNISDPEDPITGRRAALRACLIRPKDSQNMALLRVLIYLFVVRQAHVKPDIFGIPVSAWQSQRKYKPQITLYFREDREDVDAGYEPVVGEISFRVMADDDDLLPTEQLRLAREIDRVFGRADGFVWRKGKEMFSYTDWNRGYQLQLLCRDKTHARTLVERVLEIQNHNPEWKRFNENKNEVPADRYPTIPPQRRVGGELIRMPRERPIADVRFQYASLLLYGREPIILCDRTGWIRKALVNPLNR